MKSSVSHMPGFSPRPSPLSPRTGVAPLGSATAAGSASGSLSQLSDAEDLELLKALKSPLLIQTPLQASAAGGPPSTSMPGRAGSRRAGRPPPCVERVSWASGPGCRPPEGRQLQRRRQR
jgi:hypothetical protein